MLEVRSRMGSPPGREGRRSALDAAGRTSTGLKKSGGVPGKAGAAASRSGRSKRRRRHEDLRTHTTGKAGAEANEHFGSAPFFTICDTATGSYDVDENVSHHHASTGRVIPWESLEGRKIDAVICAGMGARALQRLNEGGMKVYLTVPGSVEEASRNSRRANWRK